MQNTHVPQLLFPLHTSSICSCSLAPLTSNSPSILPLIFLVFLSLSFFSGMWILWCLLHRRWLQQRQVLYLYLLSEVKFFSRHIASESSPLTSCINALTTVHLFKAGQQCCNAPHQLVCSPHTTVHTEPSAVCARQECSARSPAEMRKDCLASDLVGSQMQMQRLVWADSFLLINECGSLYNGEK